MLIKPVFVPKEVRLLARPPVDAPAWRQEAFKQELSKAESECDMVIVMTPVRPAHG
jgi:hypothetical protein